MIIVIIMCAYARWSSWAESRTTSYRYRYWDAKEGWSNKGHYKGQYKGPVCGRTHMRGTTRGRCVGAHTCTLKCAPPPHTHLSGPVVVAVHNCWGTLTVRLYSWRMKDNHVPVAVGRCGGQLVAVRNMAAAGRTAYEWELGLGLTFLWCVCV